VSELFAENSGERGQPSQRLPVAEYLTKVYLLIVHDSIPELPPEGRNYCSQFTNT